MNNPTRILSIVALALLLSTPLLAQEGGLRYTITVTEFENQAGWRGQWNLGHAWGTVLTDMLTQNGSFIVLGESDMRGAALDEQDFGASGRTAGGKKTPVIGQMTPAQILVKGAITHVQDGTKKGGGGVRIKGFRIGGKGGQGEVNATVYLVDSTTGQVMASTNVVGVSNRKGANVGYSSGNWGAAFGGEKNDNVGLAVQDACAQAVEFLVGQIPSLTWSGSVVMVKDGKVYVNRGTREGISVGQTFQVGQVEVLRDPDTGEVLDESMTQIATLKVEQVKEKISICSVTSGDAAALTKGMTVHLP
jgi:curli biogenesis system outer membrane secretion channel CsgG